MAVRHRIWNARMADKVFKVFIAVNVLCQFCPCRTSVDIRGQAFIQTDNELRYVIDSGPSALHLSSGQSIYDQSLSSVVRFDPPSLDFNEQAVGMPHTERVMVLNMDRQSSLHLLSISGSTSHFHCSFFQDKLVPPLGNTTFEVVFLARQVGSIENTLYIHSSKGSFKYQVSGIGIHNPYRIRSFLGAKVPVNSSFSPVIHMYNPHGSVLQVQEIYTSGGDLHLELPTGEREASRELWEIPPFETKMIMRASFVGRVENNHTAFIRIRTNKDDKQQMLIVPVEVEVTSEQGLFSLLELLDFGLLRSIDDPFQLRLNVINSGSTSIQIANVSVQPPNPAVHIDFRPIQLKPDIFNPTSIAVISFAASEVTSLKQCSGKIVVRSKNSDHKLSIPYQATVLHGSLVYDRNQTLFYSGGLTSEAQQNVTREIRVTNTFNITVVVYNIVLSPTSRQMFTISNFTRPCSVSPQQTAFLFSLKFHPNTTMLQFTTDVYLHTNTSIFKIPIYVYHGRLKVIHHRPEIFKGQLDFGTLAMGEKHVMNFTLRNDNPVDVNIDKFSANMEGAVVHLLGVERGNATTLSGPSEDTTLETTELVLKPFHMAVFGVTITAPNREGTFSAEVIINTQFEFLYIPMTLRTAEGGLSLSATGPDKLLWNKCFPGRVSPSELRVHSSFGHPLEVRTISFSPNDTRFYYVPIKEKPIVMASNQDTLIGHVYFDPRRECRDDCYVSLPTHIPAGHTWLLGSTLDHEVTDTDQYLFTRYRQKWDDLCAAQMSTVNVTVQLDSNKVRGFLFPAQAQLYWPSMTRRARIKFPLTQIGNVSLSEFVLENPADVPVVVQVLPLNVYPNVQTLLDTITPSLIPHEIGSDLVVSGEDDPDSDVFTLPDLTEQSGLQPMPPGDTTSLNALRRAVETTLGVRPHRRTFSMLVPPRVKLTVRSKFQPKDDGLKTSLIIIRNNLTIIDAVVVQGQGGYGELKFSNRKPGSQKPLTFEMTEKQLKNCDKRAYSSTRNIPPSFTMKRTFTARNTGQLPIYINAMNIGNSDCEGYGFKVLDCNSFELLPNDSRKVDIMFTPDFTMSRIRQTLTLHTSLSTIPLNFTLQATIPAHMLSLCASTLPRPSWEPLLYYAAVLAMGFLLFCVVVASYFEADRISVTDSIRRRAEMTQAAAAYEKGRVFDLRTITSGLRQPVVAGDVTDKMKNGSTYAAITPSGIVKSRLSVGELSSNGYAVSSGKFASSDGAPKSNSVPSEGLVRRFLSRHLSSTSPETVSTCPDTSGKDVKPRVGVESVSCAGNGNRGKVSNLVRKLVWLLSIPVGVATQLKSIACRVWVMPKKLRRLSVPTKDSGTPNSSCGTCLEGLVNLPNGGNDLDSSAAVTKSDTRSATVQGRKSEKSSAAGSPSSPGDDFVSFRGSGSSRNSRPKKSGKSAVKEKLADAEKLAASSLFDKDDSSSTTTETSSIEADDKILGLNVSDLGDQHLSSKGKRPANSKYRHDMAKIPITEPSPLAVAPSFTAPTLDQFIPATNKTKGTKKAKLDTNSLKTTPIELPYTIKRAGSESGPTVVKDVQRPKQAVSPPLSSSASTSSTNGSTQRRKASKSKSTDGTVGSVDVATQRDRNASYCVWEMPTPGGRHVADLSDLSAQTDAFARSHRPQSASPKETLSPASGLMRSSATPPLSTPPVPSRSSSYSSVVSCASIGRAKSPDLVPSGMKYESDTTMTSPSDVDISPIGRHSPGLNPIGSTSIRPSVASRPVAAVGAVRRSWLPRDANAQSLSSIGDEIMMMGGPPALYCRPANNSSYANHSNPMLSAGVGDGLLISPASTFSPPPLNLDPVMAGFVSANPNTMINMMPSNDGIVDQCGSEYGAVGASKVPSHVSDHQATMMQVLQADRRRRYLEYQQRKKLERNSREWPGFEQPAISKCFDDSIWERSSPSPPQAWPEFVPMGGNQQSLAQKGPTLQQQPMPAGLWGRNPPSAGWNAAGSFEFWGSEASAGTGNTTDYHGVEDGSSVFDPFNSLDMNRIWNPNSSDTSSSVSGWSLGMAVQRPDNN